MLFSFFDLRTLDLWSSFGLSILRPSFSIQSRFLSLPITSLRILYQDQSDLRVLQVKDWHSCSFTLSLSNNHFTSYSSFLGMNYSNVIGYLLILVFVLQLVSGILSIGYYSPLYSIASDPVLYIMIEVHFGRLIRWYHVIGASLFTLFLLLHFIRGLWLRLRGIDTLSYIWYSGVLLLAFSLIEGFCGYIPNRGQMSYWGVTVMINPLCSFLALNRIRIASRIAELIWCSSKVIINRIFVVHFPLAFLIGSVIFPHPFPPHPISSSNPLFNTCSTSIPPSFPISYNDCFITLIWCSFSYALFLFFEPDLSGNCDNLIFANPIPTPNHISPEWYFLLFHSCLRAFPNKTMGVILVLLLFQLEILIKRAVKKERTWNPRSSY